MTDAGANSQQPAGHGAAGPHQGQPVRQAGAALPTAQVAVVMLHGRGANAASILELARVIDRPDAAYLAPEARGGAWYPHRFIAPWQENEPNVSSALRAVADVVSQIEAAGTLRQRIVLLGFSQGACLAAEFAARHPARYGGIAILTGGLIGERLDQSSYQGSFEGTPVLLASGDPDPHVPWSRVTETADVYRALNASVILQRYPGLPHTVSQDEVERVRAMIDAAVGSA